MPQVIPQLSLKTAQVNPVTWQPIEYKPMQEDMNLLANSFARMEERRKTANEKISAMDIAFGEMRSKLHQDAETLNWFDNWSKGIKDQVQQAAQFGNYGEAINSAVRLAGEAAKNGELIDRIKTNEQYQNWIKKLDNDNTINQVTKDRLKAQNPYTFTPIIDKNGIYLGGEEWKPNQEPVKTIDRNQIAQFAAQVTASVEGQDAKHRYERKPAEKIQIVRDAVLKQFPGALDSLKQDYEDDKWRLEQLEQQRDALQEQINNNPMATTEDIGQMNRLNSSIAEIEQRIRPNGVDISDIEYMGNIMNPMIDNMAINNSWKLGGSGSSGGGGSVGTIPGITGYPTGMDALFGLTLGGMINQNFGEFAKNAVTYVENAVTRLKSEFPTYTPQPTNNGSTNADPNRFIYQPTAGQSNRSNMFINYNNRGITTSPFK